MPFSLAHFFTCHLSLTCFSNRVSIFLRFSHPALTALAASSICVHLLRGMPFATRFQKDAPNPSPEASFSRCPCFCGPAKSGNAGIGSSAYLILQPTKGQVSLHDNGTWMSVSKCSSSKFPRIASLLHTEHTWKPSSPLP